MKLLFLRYPTHHAPMRPHGLILLLVGLPIIIFLIALFGYYFQWFSGGMRNQGSLLTPPVTWQQEQWRTQSRMPLTPQKWHLLVLAESCEDPFCIALLRRLRSIHEAIGGTSFRVERVLLLPHVSVSSITNLQQNFPHLRVLSAMPAAFQSFTASVASSIEMPLVLIMDPLGNVILHYAHNQVDRPLLLDLKRLLAVSRVG